MEKEIIEAMGIIHFPCHSREKIIVFNGTKGRCSARCPYCNRFAMFDFDTMESVPISAQRGTVHKLMNNSYIN